VQQSGGTCAPTPSTYAYDPLNRIETAREAEGTATGAESWKQRFTCDHFGNRRIDGNPDDPTTSQSSSDSRMGFESP
jgi:hypothetical protein